MAGYDRVVVRPRAFWNGKNGSNAIATVGATSEHRRGGTMPGRVAPDGFAFVEGLTTRHVDAGGVLKVPFASGVFSARASGSSNDHRHQFGAAEHDRHDTWFGEASVSAARGVTSGVIGAAFQFERFSSADVARFNYRYTIPAVFAQLDADAGGSFAASASMRADAHSRYGTVLNPRFSLLFRAPHQWTARLSAGTGAFVATPLTEETEATGLSPMAAFPTLNVERGRGASLDVGGRLGAFEFNATAFASRIADPLGVRPVSGSPGAIEIFNATLPTYAVGADALVRHRIADVVTTITYTHVRSTEESPLGTVRRTVPLTPRHTAGLVSVWEREGAQRIGIEVYYTGRQPLDDNPYLSESRAYVSFGAIAERRLGRARVFVNFENLGDTRMTRYQSLVRSTPGLGGRWTTDAWGPLEGRTINAGVRLNVIKPNAERISHLSRHRNQ
jgi:iron complex outermembrane receptor protein